jgi:hypothetical protein
LTLSTLLNGKRRLNCFEIVAFREGCSKGGPLNFWRLLVGEKEFYFLFDLLYMAWVEVILFGRCVSDLYFFFVGILRFGKWNHNIELFFRCTSET